MTDIERTHSTWFHFTKQPRYYAAMDEIREEHAPKTLTHRGGGQAHGNHRNPDNNFGSDKPRWPNPLGKLPGSVWTDLTWEQCVERLVKGWAPKGICTVCGEGRRPVVEKAFARRQGYESTSKRAQRMGNIAGFTERVGESGSTEATITGYACACPEPTAPTNPPNILICHPLAETPA